MKDIRNIFSKKQVCMPLTNIRGRHVEKYRSFKNFLNHNHIALNAIADMELLYHSGRPFGLTQVRTHYENLLEAVFGTIYSMEKLSGRDCQALADAARRLDTAISEDLAPEFTYDSRDIVLLLEQITPDMKKMVGAKAANLALVKNRTGLPVPDGFAVTAYAFERFMEDSQLSKPIARELSKMSPDSLGTIETISKRIRSMIMDADVPEDISNEIRRAYALLEQRTSENVLIAMRSSAIGEDTEATFAGQYSTVLNVGKGNVLDAYKTVLASKYSVKAISYRLRYGLSDRETPMCVAGIVMVDPQSSGVVYTLNSSPGASDTVKITSLWGLGEQLVDGSASSDVFTVDRKDKTIIKREISRKEYRLVTAGPGETKIEEAPEDEKERPSLDDGTIGTLCQYGLLLEEFFGGPQDIEWAKDRRGNLLILQSRPLSLPEATSDKADINIDPVKYPVLVSAGKTASPGIAAGKIYIATRKDDMDAIEDNSILVTRTASPDYAKVIGKIKGIITDIGSPASHLSSVAREFGVPAIVDTRNATSLLTAGETVTMSADTTTVYKGLVEALVRDIRPAKKPIFESPVHRKMRRILDYISPLTLTDPGDTSFSPEGCKTIHDIVRYTHEQSVKSMFGITEETDEMRSVRLEATIPIVLRLIDLGGGLSRELTTCHTVTPQHIESVPMSAVWRGFTHPGISWSGAIMVDMKKLLTLFAVSATSDVSETLGGISYAIISGEYMNLSVKFGYHFATIDALCSKNSGQNYAALQFSGGAGSYYGKSLRISFLGNVLKILDFQVTFKGDLLEASIVGYDEASLKHRLDLLGRLLASSRLLDMSISGQDDVERMTDDFFREDYEFLSQKRDDQLSGFYTREGNWKRSIENGRPYFVQDGSQAGLGISSGVAKVMGRLVGQALQDFLDNIGAYYYFPLAIAKGSLTADGTLSVRVKPVSGNIDRAGGLAFGIRNVNNYLVLRVNALEDNVILFEYVEGKRMQRAAVKKKIESGKWHQVLVEVKGNSIKGYLEGELIMEYAAERPPEGFVGLWTKADSVTYFDELTIQTGNQKRTIGF